MCPQAFDLVPKLSCLGGKGNRSFRPQVVSPTSRFAYIEVVSPTQPKVDSPTGCESIRLH